MSGNSQQRRVTKRWHQRNTVRTIVNNSAHDLLVHDYRGHVFTVPHGYSVDTLWRTGNKIHVMGEPYDQGEQEFLANCARSCVCCPDCNPMPCGGCQQGGACDQLCHCGGYDDSDFDDGQDESEHFKHGGFVSTGYYP